MFDMQRWISSEPTIVVRGRQLMVVSNNTESFSDKQTGRYPDAAVVVIAGSLAVLGFLAMFFIITSLCHCRERYTSYYDP